MPAAFEIEGPAGPLHGVVAHPASRPADGRCLLLCHGLPLTRGGGRTASGTLPELADHLAAESGWEVAACSLSGSGLSPGTFSGTRWREDLAAFVDHLAVEHQRVWLAGFGFGGALSLDLAAHDDRVRGVASFAAPAEVAQWAGTPERFLAAVIASGAVSSTVPIEDADTLLKGACAIDPLSAMARIPPRRILLVHGSDDWIVPLDAARELLSAADGRAELRVIQGAGHWLRSDPRLVATLIGWLDRNR